MPEGVILMYMDFDNQLAREVQSAYWDCTSVSIHSIVCFYNCTKVGCNKLVTDKFMQITKEKKHDSFLPRLAEEMIIESLIEKGIPVSIIVQVCDNASTQYKCA